MLWATQTPSNGNSDPAVYMQWARQLSHLSAPTIAGHQSSFFPIGYPLVLAPITWLVDQTDVMSQALAASLLNVVLGTITIVLVARLARATFGARAAGPAAWLVALSGGQVFFTSVAVSETLFGAVVMLGLVLLQARLAGGRSGPGTWWLVSFGVLTGFATVVRSTGLVLVLALVLALRGRHRTWATVIRSTGLVAVGLMLVLIPSLVRNGVQAGAWTPLSTNNAGAMCVGHIAGADGKFAEDRKTQEICFAGSAYTADPDEGAWYRRATRRAVFYALHHPVDELRLTALKTYYTMSDEGAALNDAEDFGAQPLLSGPAHQALYTGANIWYWATLTLAVAGLLLLPAVRRASWLWASALALLASVWLGHGDGRYHHTIELILAVLAGAPWAALRRAGEREVDADRERRDRDGRLVPAEQRSENR